MKKSIINNLLLIGVALIVLSNSYSLSSQELTLIPISIGEYFEQYLAENYDMPNLQLVNILTSNYINFPHPNGGYYDYNFITDGEYAGYASHWSATYYDPDDGENFTITIYARDDTDKLYFRI